VDKNQTLEEFATRFREALKRQGYSPSQQKVLGELFGVSGAAVRKWADGQAMPTSTRMSFIAEKLEVRRAWLQDGEGPMMADALVAATKEDIHAQNTEIISSEEESLIHRFRRLTDDQKEILNTLLYTIDLQNFYKTRLETSMLSKKQN
jgi:hypothetical protein